MKCEDYNQFSVLCQACEYPDKIACCKKTDKAAEDSHEKPLMSFIIEDRKNGEKITASVYGPYISEAK